MIEGETMDGELTAEQERVKDAAFREFWKIIAVGWAGLPAEIQQKYVARYPATDEGNEMARRSLSDREPVVDEHED